MGLQFENLVLNNFQTLARRIGLVGKGVESAAPYFRRGRTAGNGVQIDMLVQLPKSVYLVEVKRMNFIPVAVEQDVQRKIDRLPLKKGTFARTVLVYDGELAPELEEDGFFRSSRQHGRTPSAELTIIMHQNRHAVECRFLV